MARAEHGLSLAAASRRAGLAPDTMRRVEGGDPGVSISTLVAAGEAVGMDIVISAYRGRSMSLRDTGQLKVAQSLAAIAGQSWEVRFEMTAGEHGEAADLVLLGPTEIIHAEIDRLVLDFQDRYRRNSRKRDWIAAHHDRPVRLVMVVEDSARNRSAILPHARLIQSIFPSTSRDVLASLRSGRPLGQDGLLWIRRRDPPRG